MGYDGFSRSPGTHGRQAIGDLALKNILAIGFIGIEGKDSRLGQGNISTGAKLSPNKVWKKIHCVSSLINNKKEI
jgi:hypothetical protein